MKSEKLHWLATKMNQRCSLSWFFSNAWYHLKNSQTDEENSRLCLAEKLFHRLDADIFFHSFKYFIESSLHLRIAASDWFEEFFI